MRYRVETVTDRGVIEPRHFEDQGAALDYARSMVRQGRHAQVLSLGATATLTHSAVWVGGRLELQEVVL